MCEMFNLGLGYKEKELLSITVAKFLLLKLD
jgi:hypothetical protein